MSLSIVGGGKWDDANGTAPNGNAKLYASGGTPIQTRTQAPNTFSLATTNLNANGFADYDVYLYVDETNNPTSNIQVSINGGASTTYRVLRDYPNNNPTFTQSNSTTAGNYIMVSGLTSDTFTATFANATNAFYGAVLDGVQITQEVPSPEPTSLALIGLAGVPLLSRRRRLVQR